MSVDLQQRCREQCEGAASRAVQESPPGPLSEPRTRPGRQREVFQAPPGAISLADEQYSVEAR